MLPHRKAYAAALVTVVIALGSAVSGCSDSGGLTKSEPLGKPTPVLTTVTYTASRTDSGTPTAEDMRMTADRMRKRAKALGLKDTDVRVDGTVITIVAPRSNAERLEQLTAAALLEFRSVLDPATAADSGLKQAYDSMVCDRTTRPIPAQPARPTVACDSTTGQKYLLGPTDIGGADVESATATFNAATGSGWLVNLAFSPAGTTAFTEVTGTLSQHTPPANQFAIVIDGEVISAPAVASAIAGGRAQISGNYTKEGAENLAAAISSGALPVQLTSNDTKPQQ
jgi:preprotein translocase subunit SecD